MEFFLIVLVLIFVSIAWAFASLIGEMKKTEEHKKVKEDLAKGRVIFYSSSEKSDS